jgi:hypothetical protein
VGGTASGKERTTARCPLPERLGATRVAPLKGAKKSARYRSFRGLGFFGSGAACQFTPSIVFSKAFAAAGVALSSPSHEGQASSSRIAGMRGSSSWDLIVRRMNSFAGTVA